MVLLSTLLVLGISKYPNLSTKKWYLSISAHQGSRCLWQGHFFIDLMKKRVSWSFLYYWQWCILDMKWVRNTFYEHWIFWMCGQMSIKVCLVMVQSHLISLLFGRQYTTFCATQPCLKGDKLAVTEVRDGDHWNGGNDAHDPSLHGHIYGVALGLTLQKWQKELQEEWKQQSWRELSAPPTRTPPYTWPIAVWCVCVWFFSDVTKVWDNSFFLIACVFKLHTPSV